MMIWSPPGAYSFFPLPSPALTYLTHSSKWIYFGYITKLLKRHCREKDGGNIIIAITRVAIRRRNRGRKWNFLEWSFRSTLWFVECFHSTSFLPLMFIGLAIGKRLHIDTSILGVNVFDNRFIFGKLAKEEDVLDSCWQSHYWWLQILQIVRFANKYGIGPKMM